MSGLVGACASTGAVPAPFPQPGASATEPAPETPATGMVTADRTGYGIAGTALALRGTPYRYDHPTEPLDEGDWEALR